MKALLKKMIPATLLDTYRNYQAKKIEQAFKGNEVICVICNSSYSQFGPFGLVKRNNACCHHCGSLERHRLIWKYLTDKNLLTNPLSILHFAPEKVFYDIFSASDNYDYTPCDLNPEEYKASGRSKIVKADITKIPFPDQSFDFILCNHVLEHIPDDQLAMTELFRVMKKDGFGIFQVPLDYNREKTYEDFSITSAAEREKAFGQADHVRWYGRDYKDRLTKAGFQVREDDFVSTFSTAEQFKYGFESFEKIYYCTRGGV